MRGALLVSAGAVAGANLRYGIGLLFARTAPTAFPWATFLINVTGSFVLGAFLGWAALRLPDAGWRLLVAVGFCGAYTTFSTFSLEVYDLLRQRAVLVAAAYVAGSVVAGVAGVAAGDAVAGGGAA